MPAIEEWEDQFNEADTDYDSRFLEWGAQWKEVLDAITASVSNINMKLTHEPKEIFNFHFARVLPQFNLSIRTDDFYAVLALVEPLYRHACHILSLLPAGTPTAPSANMTPETLFDCLPLRFTRNEAIDKGEQVGVPAGSVDSLLKRMTERGQLVKVGRGEYEFNARMHTRTCVGVRESASSASLQDS